MSEAALLSKTRSSAYNCAHFAADVWEREVGRDILPLLVGFLAPSHDRPAMPAQRNEFIRIHGPKSPCLVILRRDKAVPHIGVYVRGRMAHLDKVGPVRQLLSVASLGYTSVRFYAPR